MSNLNKKTIDIDGIDISLYEDVINIYEYTRDNRRYLHKRPESSLKEYKTSKFIQNILRENDIEFELVGETGIFVKLIGENGENNSKTVFLRADMDALEILDKKGEEYSSIYEGLSHACGHDAHTSSLLSATLILNKHRDKFSGTIKIAFQQAEEIGAGARLFVEKGYLDDVDYVFGTHVASNLKLGTIGVTAGAQSASCDIFKVKVVGESAHAATPDKGRDALVAISNIVVELQNIVSRQISPSKDALVSIGKLNSGTRYNIIASEGEIEGTVRTFDMETRQYILDRIEKISDLTAQIHNCKSYFTNYDAAAPLINEVEKTKYTRMIAENIVGVDNVLTNEKKQFGAEDFADYLQKAPGTFVKVGSCSDRVKNSSNPHHHEYFDIDERCLYIETQLYVETALEFLK